MKLTVFHGVAAALVGTVGERESVFAVFTYFIVTRLLATQPAGAASLTRRYG